MMLTCKQASELMSLGMDARLPISTRIALRIHFSMCHGCSNFMRQARFLSKAARRWREHKRNGFPSLTPEAKQRIVEAVRGRFAEIPSGSGGDRKSS